jgi:hypothetical protein
MARPRSKKADPSTREADLRKRAASRNYTLEKDGNVWYAAIGGTRYGPLRTLDEVDGFLPKDA